MNTSPIKFSKPFLTISEQIEQLKSRGMRFRNEKEAAFYLENLNYYRLFNTIVMTEYLMDRISENNHWRQRLESLIDKHSIDRRTLGYKEIP